MASNQQRMSALQGVLTSPRFNRLLPWAAGAVLLVGVITFLAVNYWNTADSTETALSNKPADVAAPAKKVPLGNDVKSVASLFIQKAVTRQDAALAYRLSGPDIRQGQTLAEWTRDWNNPNVGVPIVPYPARANARMKIDYSLEREAQLLWLLEPRKGIKMKPQLFAMVLDKIGGKWLVNYWGPRSTPPVPGLPER